MLKVFLCLKGAFGLDLLHEKPFSDAMTQVSKNKLIHNHLNLSQYEIQYKCIIKEQNKEDKMIQSDYSQFCLCGQRNAHVLYSIVQHFFRLFNIFSDILSKNV